jgi:hypothetical protein
MHCTPRCQSGKALLMKSLNPANDNNTILIVRRWQKKCSRNQKRKTFSKSSISTPP